MADRRLPKRNSPQLNQTVNIDRLNSPGVSGTSKSAAEAASLARTLGHTSAMFGSIGNLINQDKQRKKTEEVNDRQAGRTSMILGENAPEDASESFLKGRIEIEAKSDGINFQKQAEQFMVDNLTSADNESFQQEFNKFKKTHLEGMGDLPETYRNGFADYFDKGVKSIEKQWKAELERRNFEQIRISTSHVIENDLDSILGIDFASDEDRATAIHDFALSMHEKRPPSIDKRQYKAFVNNLIADKLGTQAVKDGDTTLLDYRNLTDTDGISIADSDPKLKQQFDKMQATAEQSQGGQLRANLKDQQALFHGKVNELTEDLNRSMVAIQKMAVPGSSQGIKPEQAIRMSQAEADKFKVKLENERKKFTKIIEESDISEAEKRSYLREFDAQQGYAKSVTDGLSKQFVEEKARIDNEALIRFNDYIATNGGKYPPLTGSQLAKLGLNQDQILMIQKNIIMTSKADVKLREDKMAAQVIRGSDNKAIDGIRKKLRTMTPLSDELEWNALNNATYFSIADKGLAAQLRAEIKAHRSNDKNDTVFNSLFKKYDEAFRGELVGAEIDGSGWWDDDDLTGPQINTAILNLSHKAREVYMDLIEEGKSPRQAEVETDKFLNGEFKKLEDETDLWATKWQFEQTSTDADPNAHKKLPPGQSWAWDYEQERIRKWDDSKDQWLDDTNQELWPKPR